MNYRNIKVTLVFVAALVVLVISAMTNDVHAQSENIDVTARVTEQEQIQIKAHEMADAARCLGFKDGDDIIITAGQIWSEAEAKIAGYEKLSTYTVYERDLLASVLMQEGRNCPKDFKEYVAAVVLNRIADSRFPNTIHDVVYQSGQYPGIHIYSQIDDACYEATDAALMGFVDTPADLIYQAEFTQGSRVWLKYPIDTGYYKSTTYFCEG